MGDGGDGGDGGGELRMAVRLWLTVIGRDVWDGVYRMGCGGRGMKN